MSMINLMLSQVEHERLGDNLLILVTNTSQIHKGHQRSLIPGGGGGSITAIMSTYVKLYIDPQV